MICLKNHSNKKIVTAILIAGLGLSLFTGIIQESACAQSISGPALPDLGTQRVYLIGNPAGIDPQKISDEIGRVERSSRQKYYVVVVRNAGKGASSARDFMDSMGPQWVKQSASKGITFDTKRGVVILVDLENRKIVMHGGTELRQDYDFRDPYLDRELIVPHFRPLAQKGDMTRAITELIVQTDRWVASKEKTSPVEESPVDQKVIPNTQTQPQLPRYYWTKTNLTGFAVLTLVVVGAIVGIKLKRRKRYRDSVIVQFQEYRSRTVSLMERLDDLRKHHSNLLTLDPSFKQPLAGKTLAVYEGLGTELNSLWDKWLSLMDVWERANRLVKSSRSYDLKKINEAKSLLDQEGKYDGIEERVELCAKQLEELSQAHTTAAQKRLEVLAQIAGLQKQLEQVTQSELSIKPYEGTLSLVDGLVRQAEPLAVNDPLESVETLDEALATIDNVSTTVNDVLSLLERSEHLETRLQASSKEVSELRRSGYKLTEREANPDLKVEKIRHLLEMMQVSLQRAETSSALKALEEAEATAQSADSDVKRFVDSKAECPKRILEGNEELAKLEIRIHETDPLINELNQSFAHGSFESVEENIERAKDLEKSARSLLEKSLVDSSEATQNYLSALESANKASEMVGRANEALTALVNRHGELLELSISTKSGLRELDLKTRELQERFQASSQVIGAEARNSFDHLIQLIVQISNGMRAGRPDWVQLDRQFQAAVKGLELTKSQAEEDIEGGRKLAERYQEVRQRERSVGQLLQVENKCRPPAIQRYRQANDLLSRFDNSNELDATDWDSRLRWVDEVAENLDRAEELANQDINLANGAAAEIEAAANSIRKMQACLSPGVSINLNASESLLAQAHGMISAQNYEAAIDAAQQAEHAASVAWNQAEHQTRRRQMQTDRSVVMGDPSILIGTMEAARTATEQWSRSSGNAGGTNDKGWTSDNSSSSWGERDSSGGGSRSSESSW